MYEYVIIIFLRKLINHHNHSQPLIIIQPQVNHHSPLRINLTATLTAPMETRDPTIQQRPHPADLRIAEEVPARRAQRRAVAAALDDLPREPRG